MTSRRKTRSQRQGQKFNVGGAWTEEEEIETQAKEQVTAESIGQKPVSKSDIDQIRSEILEEKYASSAEPEYWDESHNWDLDHHTESEEYWHFVGRYE